MSNSDIKTWLLVLVLGLGGLWQISRSFSSAAPTTLIEREHAWEAAAAARDDEPYSVTPTTHSTATSRPHLSAVKPVDLPVASGSLSPAELAKLQAGTAHVGEVSDKKKADKCEPQKDPKTGKLLPCKTKKKKKKAAKTEDTAQNKKTTTKPSDSDSKGIDWNVNGAVQTGQIVGPVQKPDVPYDSLEAWEARLLPQADLAATKQFIDHFQRNLVSSDIFFRITQEMLDDSRADMKSLGVMCAAVNVSATSFTMLANFVEKERSGTTPRTQADTALNRYSELANLSILASIMRGATDYPTYVAIQKLDTSIQRNLTIANTTATNPTTGTANGTPTAAQTAALTKNRTYYTRFVTILQSLAKSSDNLVKAQASSTLASLQGKLGTTTAPTAPTAPTAGGTTGQPNTGTQAS